MVKVLFFRVRVTNSRLKIKNFTSSYQLDGCTFFSHFQVTNVKLINEKKYSLNAREPLEIDTTP